jgi:hypothetical protein
VFGVASATYAFNEGLKRKDKTTHELLLRAIITVTNVVPRQLPVQMALQVNHALMTLMKEVCDGGFAHARVADHATAPGHLLHRAVPRAAGRQDHARALRQDGHAHFGRARALRSVRLLSGQGCGSCRS